jgi:hypothetical protein
MHNESLRRRSYFQALLIAVAMGGLGAGCGEADDFSEKTSALSLSFPRFRGQVDYALEFATRVLSS